MSREIMKAWIVDHKESIESSESISSSEARAIILSLLPTMGTVSRRNQSDLSHYKLNRQKVTAEIQSTGKVPTTEIINTPLPYPRTVCTSEKCIGYVNGTTHYETICHKRCYLQGIPIASFPEEGLKKCEAMYVSGTCKECGCNYKMHMHIDYEQRITSNLSFTDIAATVINVIPILSIFGRYLREERSFIKSQDEAETLLKEREKQLEDEQTKITNAFSAFAAFLKDFSGTYNEDIENQLKIQLRNANVIAKNTSNNDVVDRLEAVYHDFKEKNNMIMEISGHRMSDTNITADMINSLKEELFNLPINGAIIKDSFERTFKL